jgi:hypothetical protein
MMTSKRDAKKQFDRLLSIASLESIRDHPEPKLRALLREFLQILYGADAEKQNYYDRRSARAVSFRHVLQRLAGELHSLIQDVRKEAGRAEQKGRWHVIPGRPFKFRVSYDVYSKDDKVSVRPLWDNRVLTKTKEDERGDLSQSLEEDEEERFNLLKYRFFSLMEKAELPLSSIRVCTKCKGFFSATERKKDKRCRKCLQRAIHRKWAKERGL